MSRLRKSWLMQAVMALVWCSFIAARPAVLSCPSGGHGAEHGMAHGAMQGMSAPAESPIDVNGSALTSAAHAASVHEESAPHAHMAHTAPATTSDGQGERSPAPHPCDCLGHCCAIVAMPQQPAAVVLRVVERVGQVSLPQEHPALVTRWVDFVLPFAIAPPVSVRT